MFRSAKASRSSVISVSHPPGLPDLPYPPDLPDLPDLPGPPDPPDVPDLPGPPDLLCP